MHVLLLSGNDSPELRSIAADLADLLPESQVDRVSNVRTAVERISNENRHPDLLIVAQSEPDEFTRAEVVELFRLAPLARWICCYRSWCESDGRNRDLWPPGSRVPFRGFRARLASEIKVLQGKCAPLPLTASRDEVFEFDASRMPEKPARRVRVRIESPDREFARWLGDLIQNAGSTIVPANHDRSHADEDVLLLDLDPWQAGASLRIRAESKTSPRMIGLMGMPYTDDVEAAHSAGIQSVLSKLAPFDELLAAIAR